MTEYPVSQSMKQYPCKCGHTFAEHRCSPDLKDDEPCQVSHCGCDDFWANFEEGNA
jgi:hypothetical protein